MPEMRPLADVLPKSPEKCYQLQSQGLSQLFQQVSHQVSLTLSSHPVGSLCIFTRLSHITLNHLYQWGTQYLLGREHFSLDISDSGSKNKSLVFWVLFFPLRILWELSLTNQSSCPLMTPYHVLTPSTPGASPLRHAGLASSSAGWHCNWASLYWLMAMGQAAVLSFQTPDCQRVRDMFSGSWTNLVTTKTTFYLGYCWWDISLILCLCICLFFVW